MPTKVLVFESDSAFAGELRNELGNLGCTTTVVDDGNLGLQQAAADKPDLILLSIELPRMNGFSVCNKLKKKDAGLKDIPLIIMSSESSEETFEQHKKLRTRAEDYVHKPVAFGELLQHIQSFVPLGAPPPDGEGVIVIDDEIEVGSTDYVLEDDDASQTAVVSAGTIAESRKLEKVDAESDAFAESAFGRITAPGATEARAGNGAPAADGPRPPPPRASTVASPPAPRASTPPPARMSVRPATATGVDPVEHERLRDDLARARERLSTADNEIGDARREVEKLTIEAGEAERFAREVDELKAKLAAGTKTGGISSRALLDLREALNKKDKEILALKEQASKKDKEIARRPGTAASRSSGGKEPDLDERLLTPRARGRGDAREERGPADRQGSREEGERRSTRTPREGEGEGETRDRQLSELRTKQAEERAASDAKLAAARADLDQELANERANQARALDEAEARRQADLEQAEKDKETALSASREQAEQAKRDALSSQAAQLRQEHDAAVASARRAHQDEIDHARTEAAEHARAAEETHEKAQATARKEADERLAKERTDAAQREQAALTALRGEHGEKVAAIEKDRDARIASIENDRDSWVAALEAKSARELGESNDKLAKLEMDLAAVRGELQPLRETKEATDASNATRIAELEKRIAETESARDDLSAKLDVSTRLVATLEGELTEVRGELASTKESLGRESSRAEKAVAKWAADKQSLERAKDALAVALTQIEEAESRV